MSGRDRAVLEARLTISATLSMINHAVDCGLNIPHDIGACVVEELTRVASLLKEYEADGHPAPRWEVAVREGVVADDCEA